MKISEREKARKRGQRIRNGLNLCLILAGVLTVFFFMSYMQREYSVRRSNQDAQVALDTVIETLDTNTEKVAALRERYHTDNQTVLDDVYILLEGRQGEEMLTADAEARSASIARLSRVVTGSGYLFVIDSQGRVVVAPDVTAIG